MHEFSKRYHASGSKPQATTPVLFYKVPGYWSTMGRRRTKFGTKAQQYLRTVNPPRHQATQRDEDNSFLCIRKGRRTTHVPADETTSYNGSKGKGSVLVFMYRAMDACGGMTASSTDNRRTRQRWEVTFTPPPQTCQGFRHSFSNLQILHIVGLYRRRLLNSAVSYQVHIF